MAGTRLLGRPSRPSSPRVRRAPFALIAALLVVAIGTGAGLAQRSGNTNPRALPGADSSNFVDFDQITKTNVKNLQVAWYYPHAAAIFSPVAVDGVLYGLGRNSSALVALDATTGKEIWVHDGLQGIVSKGINFWQSEDGKDRRLLFSVNSFLQAIDARTGKSILSFGKNGIVDMRAGLRRAEGTGASAQQNSPGRIWRNLLILGGSSGEAFITPPGDIRAYDVVTGERVWQFHTVPEPGEFGYETNPKEGYKYIGGANNWGEMSVDEERGIVYIPTGSATYDFYGADRHGANLFANCLLALDARTGKRLWHFQTIHHDLWDLDNVSAPQLVTVRQNGQTIPAVAHAGKTGFLYVFNRVTGQPLWPIEERPVMKTDVPGEYSSPTQPFPTKPPAFVRQSFGVDDVNPWLLSKEQYEDMRARVAKAKNGTGPQGGLFIPPSLGIESISMPGNQGGANWGVTAGDPQRGMVFVVGVNQVALLKLEDVKTRQGGSDNQASGTVLSRGQAAYAQHCSTCHGANMQGAQPGVPSIVGVTSRMDADAIRAIVQEGRGLMRPLLEIGSQDLNAIVAYLTATNPFGRGGGANAAAMGGPSLPPGPTVATGGAPRPAVPARGLGPYYPGAGGNAGNIPWPDELEDKSFLPPTRFMSGYNVMATYTKPPYTTLTAYDLNSGTIKWQIAPGDHPPTVARGGPRGTGGVGARNGVLVTRSGIVFHAAGDYKVRAYDEDTGKELWSGAIPGSARGIPTMYMANGKQYLVIAVPAGQVQPGAAPGADAETGAPVVTETTPRGYVAFALP
ncbi:MAG: PQQ-binding-like beta-propeller repeat protein [Acidobacteria bacterium]|nr:PQQ-binding-like beta-propeller repeat protein [Acidobacteriota bacterium]